MPHPTSSPVASAAVRPVDAGERLVLIDTLRGFALGGVFLANVYLWFSGRLFLSRAQLDALLQGASWLDTFAHHAFNALVAGRFVTIFSFLFGLGFSVQLARAEGRGTSIVPLYTRRLAVMLGLGLTHLFLLYQGDIVSTYALMGFTLLLFRQRADRTLLLWAAVLIFLVPMLVTVAMKLPQWLGPRAAATTAQAVSDPAAVRRAQVMEVFMHGSWLDTVRAGAAYYVSDMVIALSFFLPIMVGRFLLGLWAGRRRLFHDAPRHLPFFRRLLGWGLAVGLLASGVGLFVGQLVSRKIIIAGSIPWLTVAMGPVRHLGELGIAGVYVAGITLLFQREAWQRRLAVFAPVGRMALTNYFLQSLLAGLLFYGYGLGLMGTLGSAASLAVAAALFAVQILFSHLWMARFRFGPVEWVWRSLTYGGAQPLRRAPGLETQAPMKT